MDADGLLRGRCDTFSTSGSICVAGVARSVPAYVSAEAWRRTGTHGRRGLLRDRRDAFSMSGSICVCR